MIRPVVDANRRALQRRLRTLIAGRTNPPTEVVSRADDGLFGPHSVTWVVHADPAMLVGGLRALLYQTAHPLAMAGVADHSDYRADPLGRLHRTAHFLGATTYGDTATAESAITAVRRIHRRVRGVAPDGRPYRATDPRLLLWVHATEVDSFLTAFGRYGTAALHPDDADRYVAEMAEVGRRLGVPHPPTDVPELEVCLAGFRPELAAGAQARSAIRFLSVPRRLPLAARAPYGLLFAAAVALLPDHIRRIHRLPLAPGSDALAIRPATATAMRALGWVLESPDELVAARQRLAARR